MTFWGLPPPLSVKLTEADRAPVALGENVSMIEQLAPGPTVDPQVLVWAKSPELVPVIKMLVILKFTLPILVRSIVIGRLVVPTF